MVSAAFKYAPQTSATTFAFSYVFIMFLNMNPILNTWPAILNVLLFLFLTLIYVICDVHLTQFNPDSDPTGELRISKTVTNIKNCKYEILKALPAGGMVFNYFLSASFFYFAHNYSTV